MSNTVAVVLGYGCHLTESIKRYLERVAAYESAYKFSVIITTGGFTEKKSAPGISEAWLMANYLKAFGVSAPVILEERARTTTENLRNVARLIRERGLEGKPIMIFADSCRALKVRLLARLIIGVWPMIRKYDLSRRFTAKLRQWFLATPFDLLGFFIPALERVELRLRARLNASR